MGSPEVFDSGGSLAPSSGLRERVADSLEATACSTGDSGGFQAVRNRLTDPYLTDTV